MESSEFGSLPPLRCSLTTDTLPVSLPVAVASHHLCRLNAAQLAMSWLMMVSHLQDSPCWILTDSLCTYVLHRRGNESEDRLLFNCDMEVNV
jgi:hypothetical protein